MELNSSFLNSDSVEFMDYACDFDFWRFLLARKCLTDSDTDFVASCIPALIRNSLRNNLKELCHGTFGVF